jgi:hypothetical protein
VSDQKQVAITDLWGQDDRAFLVFARSMGVCVPLWVCVSLTSPCARSAHSIGSNDMQYAC